MNIGTEFGVAIRREERHPAVFEAVAFFLSYLDPTFTSHRIQFFQENELGMNFTELALFVKLFTRLDDRTSHSRAFSSLEKDKKRLPRKQDAKVRMAHRYIQLSPYLIKTSHSMGGKGKGGWGQTNP